MSRILVVEPQKILQQAIVWFLFPDHEVEVSENVLAKETVKDFDLAIVDAAALREVNLLSAQWSRAVEGWKMPTIWIDDAAGAPVPTGKHLVVLGRPMQRDVLLAALAKCLGASSFSKQNGTRSLSATDRSVSLEITAEEASTATGAPVIELVDVVEEEPERKKNRKQQRNTE
jgi:hypothetical protein